MKNKTTKNPFQKEINDFICDIVNYVPSYSDNDERKGIIPHEEIIKHSIPLVDSAFELAKNNFIESLKKKNVSLGEINNLIDSSSSQWKSEAVRRIAKRYQDCRSINKVIVPVLGSIVFFFGLVLIAISIVLG